MDWLNARFADCLHHATRRRQVGEPFETPIVNTAIYALPGDPQGAYQYARWANPTWTALEEVAAATHGGHVDFLAQVFDVQHLKLS